MFESKEPGGLKSQIRRTQLFNLAENPNELIKEHHDPKVIELTRNKPNSQQIDLAELPKYADTLKEMEELLLSEQKRFNDPYRFWNQPKISARR